MTDIITSVPWNCGERSCETGWHLATYWYDEHHNSYSMDSYGDGDCSEEIDYDDMPGWQEEQEAWVKYYTDCIETSTDVLDQFIFPHRTREWTEVWQVLVSQSILGPILCAVRRARKSETSKTGFWGRGPWIRYHEEIPKYVGEYLNFEQDLRSKQWRVIPEFQNRMRDSQHPTVGDDDKYPVNGWARFVRLINDAESTIVQYDGNRFQFFVEVPNKRTLPPTKRMIRRAARRALRQTKNWGKS